MVGRCSALASIGTLLVTVFLIGGSVYYREAQNIFSTDFGVTEVREEATKLSSLTPMVRLRSTESPSAAPSTSPTSSPAALSSAPLPQPLVNDPRPRNLRLAFFGDSVTRYQYVSLAYFLKYGKFFLAKRVPHLVNELNFGSYKKYCEASTEMLGPTERCDCYRPDSGMATYIDIVTENRYFWEPELDNVLVYISYYGSDSHPHGRWNPEEALQNMSSFQYVHDDYNQSQYKWFTGDVAWVVREHIAKLVPKPTHLVVNAGIWRNTFSTNETLRVELFNAIKESNMTAIWKTTSHSIWGSWPSTNVTDPAMCALFDKCLNLSWTGSLRWEFVYDGTHFLEPVYRIMNEELLEMIGYTWPSHYEKKRRERFFRKPTPAT